jgi:hypothetical protein
MHLALFQKWECCYSPADSLSPKPLIDRLLTHHYLRPPQNPPTPQTTLFVMYPNMTRVALSSFSCFPADSHRPGAPYAEATAAAGVTGAFWVPDMRQQCWQGWHLRWALTFGLPLSLLLVVGVPAALAVALHAFRNKLDTPSAHRYLGFVYLPYRRQAAVWEAVQTVQTAALVAVSVFSVRLGPYYTLLLLTAMFTILIALQLAFRPHATRATHLAQVAALCVLASVTFVTLSFFHSVGFEAEPGIVYKELIGAALLLVSIAYTVTMLFFASLGLADWFKALWAYLKTSAAGCYNHAFGVRRRGDNKT